MPNPKPCSFIRETGRQCGSPAMRGEDRCHFHQRDRLRRQILATWRVNGDAHLLASMALPPLDTPEEVQICINAVFLAIAENRIDPETRRTLIDMLRLASRNLRTAALIRHFAAKDALRAAQLDAQVRADAPHTDSAVTDKESASANGTPSADSGELIAESAEHPPQLEDLELLAQLKSREEDRDAVQALLRGTHVPPPPPKPKPKMEVIIPRSTFGEDEMPDPSTAAPSSTDSGRLRSG